MKPQIQTEEGNLFASPDNAAGNSPGFSFEPQDKKQPQSLPDSSEADTGLGDLERACAAVYLYAARQNEPDETKNWSPEQRLREIPRLADELGVSPELVRFAPAAAADRAWCNRLVHLDKTPLTNRWLTEGENAGYATQSFPRLGAIEEETVSYRQGMRSLHSSVADFQFRLSAQGRERQESATGNEHAYFHLNYAETLKRLMAEAEAKGMEKEEVFSLLAQSTPDLLNGSFELVPLPEQEKVKARARFRTPVARDTVLLKTLRASNAPDDVALSLAHDLARAADWTPLGDDAFEKQDSSLFDAMSVTQDVLADTEEKRQRYIDENGAATPFVSFGQEVRYRWEEQKIGLHKGALVKQAQDLAVAREGLRVERILETAQTRALDPWIIATQVLLHGPRSLETMTDAQAEQARKDGADLERLVHAARFDEKARKTIIERYGLHVTPSLQLGSQALMELMLYQGFAKDDLLSGIDPETGERRSYHGELLRRIAERNTAVLMAGTNRKAWIVRPGGAATPVEGRNEDEVARMEAALRESIAAHEGARSRQEERFQTRHPLYQALDRHPEIKGELIWRHPAAWVDGGLANLTAGLPGAVLDVATLGSLSEAQTVAGVMLKDAGNGSVEDLRKHLSDPLSLMKAYDEASRKGMVSRTISMGSLALGAGWVAKALGFSSTVGRMAGVAGASAGVGGGAMALDQLNVEGKIDWGGIAQVMPGLLLLGVLGSGKARTPKEMAQTIKAALPEIRQQAAKVWTRDLHRQIAPIREAGVPDAVLSDYLAHVLKGGEQEVITLPSGQLRFFLEDLAAKKPDAVKEAAWADVRQRLAAVHDDATPFSMPLADLLPYLPEDARLLEAGTIGRVEGALSEVQTGTLPKAETGTSPLRTGEEVTSGDSNGGVVDALEKGGGSLVKSEEKFRPFSEKKTSQDMVRKVQLEEKKYLEELSGDVVFYKKYSSEKMDRCFPENKKEEIRNAIPLPKGASLSNVDVRRWYLEKETKILDLIDHASPPEAQAYQAWWIRNYLRTEARNAMLDRSAAEILTVTRPNVSWEQVIEKYSKNFSGKELWEQIINASQRSNSDVNKKLNVEPPRRKL